MFFTFDALQLFLLVWISCELKRLFIHRFRKRTSWHSPFWLSLSNVLDYLNRVICLCRRTPLICVASFQSFDSCGWVVALKETGNKSWALSPRSLKRSKSILNLGNLWKMGVICNSLSLLTDEVVAISSCPLILAVIVLILICLHSHSHPRAQMHQCTFHMRARFVQLPCACQTVWSEISGQEIETESSVTSCQPRSFNFFPSQ